MKVTFRIVNRLKPLLLREYKESHTGWLKCKIRIITCSDRRLRLENTYCLFQGNLPSCAPYFVFSANVSKIEGRVRLTLTPVSAGSVTYVHADAKHVTREDKDFMIEELGYKHPNFTVEELVEYRAQIRDVYLSADLRKIPIFFEACDYFRVSYERVVRKYFPRQLDAVQKLSVENLKKCIHFLSSKPYLLMFPKWSKEMFGLKQLKYPKYNTAITQYGIKLDREIQVAASLYAFVRYKLHKKDGHTLFVKNDVVRQYLGVGENIHNQSYIDRAIEFLEFKAIKFLNKNRTMFVLKRDWDNSNDVCFSLIQIQNSRAIPEQCGPEETERMLIKYHSLTDEQTDATTHVFGSWLTVILGSPGHGKSEAIVSLVKTFKNILVVTYVGMAVDMLQKRVNGYKHVYTIHYVYHRVLHTPSGWEWIRQFDIVVFDETSNIDVYLFQMILHVLNSNVCRIVLVGDTGQINPISPGNPFRDIIEAFPEHVFTFTVNLRVNPDARMLADASTMIKTNKLERLDFSTPCLEMVDRSSVKEMVSKFIRRYAYEMMNIQFVCLRNDARKDINFEVEQALLDLGVLKKTPQNSRKIRRDFWLFPGKKITFGKNYKQLEINKVVYSSVRNGELDEIEKIKVMEPNVVVTLCHSQKKVLIGDSKGAINPHDVQLGYAVTCNKAQGSEWEKVVFYIHPELENFWSREYAYVAVSRAKKSCTIVGTTDELQLICQTRANHRNTALAHMIETTMLDNIDDSSDDTTGLFG